MVKKGFVRTMEAFLAIMLSFTFLLIIVPSAQESRSETNLNVLQSFEQDEEFRICAFSSNTTCVRGFVGEQLPGFFEFDILLTTDPDQVITLPKKRVFSESLFLAGNKTAYNPSIVKLFYWEKDAS